MITSFSDLPGGDFVEQGLKDLETSSFTIPALLICIAKTRLKNAGISIPEVEQYPIEPELMLYSLILQEGIADPYSHYNSLIRRLISFEKALEQRNYSIGQQVARK